MSAAAPIVVSKTSAYTADYGECVLVDATAGAVTITLPAVAYGLREIRVKKTDSSANAVSVARAGTATIDGATSYSLATQYKSVTVVSDGTNWFVIAAV